MTMRHKFLKFIQDVMISSIIGLFISYAVVGSYDLYFDGVPKDGREAGGRFELFGYFLGSWLLYSLFVFIIHLVIKKMYPNSVYIVLQSIFIVSLVFSVHYWFARG